MTTLSRRDALKFAGSAGLGMLGADALAGRAEAAGPRPGGPIGVALCIGLNRVNPASYHGWSGWLQGCENDASDMAAIAGQAGFRVRKLLTAAATKQNIKGSLVRAAAGLLPGDILLVTYSGHGGQYPDQNGDETDDRMDETWCLFDGQVVDDELAALWGTFQPGVRVLVFADSCHSGTSTRAVDMDILSQLTDLSNNATQPPPKAQLDHFRKLDDVLDRGTELSQAQLDAINAVPSPFRAMPDSVAQMIATKDAAAGITLGAGESAKDALRSTEATILLLSGCQDNQTSRDGARNGLFTETFLNVWRANAATISDYRDLHRRVIRQMPAYQSPNYFVFGGQNPGFELQKPFTI
jgi:hypothetical protein